MKSCDCCGDASLQIYKNGLCEKCFDLYTPDAAKDNHGLIEGKDFYYENGLMVFTERFHLDRGHCCNTGCRHCPYN